MPPTAEVDPGQRHIGLETTAATLAATAVFALSTGEAVADGANKAEVEKQALAAFGQNALVRTVDSFPAQASTSGETLVPGPKGLVSAEASQASASGQLKKCVDAALDSRLVMRSIMFSPGDNLGDRQQSTEGYLRFKPTSAVCAPLVSRETPTARMKMQRPNNHRRFIRSKRKELIGNEDGIEVPMDANGGRLGYVGFGSYYGDGNKLRYRCTPGKGITKAWMTYTVRAASPADGTTLGKRSFTQPVKIARTRPDLVVDNTLPGPC